MPDTNINVQGSPNAEVNILLGKSYEYNDLLDPLNTHKKLFDLTPEEEIDERLATSKKINEITDLIEQFKRDVIVLAETFDKIEINTDRLRRAKESFDKGEIGEARAVLETEIEQMQSEQTHLLREKEHFEQDVLPKLINNAEEFLLLAMAVQTDYGNPDRFADTCRYFEDSIKSHANKENVFQYALCLQDHNKFREAENYYSQLLNDFADRLSQSDRATTLNNLAILHLDRNKYDDALKEYKEALAIRRKLAEENPDAYLPYVATTLNNLANLHQSQTKYDDALKEYEEALEIYRRLAEENPDAYLSYVATTLNNLAVLQSDRNKNDDALKEYKEALAIRSKLAEENPDAYLPYVATTLNNLAILHSLQNKSDDALKEYKEALEIYRKLAGENPDVWLPDVAMTLVNLSVYFRVAVPQREKSIAHVTEAINILLPIVDGVPFTQKYLRSATAVLKDWDFSDDEIERRVEERRKRNAAPMNKR